MEDFRGRKIEVGGGYVQLVDYMGNDKTIVNAARVSFGKQNDEPLSDKDKKLIAYLMRNHHTTPFEHVTLTFKVRVPMDTWRQWVRHRTASINEYSTRYSEAIGDMATTEPYAWRKQAEDNRQGSCGLLDYELGKELSEEEVKFQEEARRVYDHRLALGVAREQARKDLPLSTYTEAYWTVNLHNLFHFLELRLDQSAQQEIREYAEALMILVSEVCPEAVSAFIDYRLNVDTLNMREIDALAVLCEGLKFSKEEVASKLKDSDISLSDRDMKDLILLLLDLNMLKEE